MEEPLGLGANWLTWNENPDSGGEYYFVEGTDRAHALRMQCEP